MLVCDCYASGSKKCTCGAVQDGVLVNGATLHIPLLMKDSAPPAIRKELTMMNDTEIKTMRDSVRGMPVMQAAALPIYDQFRGLRDDNGTPMEQMRALYDGAVYSASEPSREACRAAAYRDHMIDDMRSAHKTVIGAGEAA